ncbi:LPXTG cell wall anchor domain-containing protein [Streptomyces sp. YS415]|uniref:LPXTG cell wall anchor domain-containing protein n=1 Tax=Streptomyces sp. YS415 TaxID=2944806 RepID=UPI0020210233|nr:LPXTG cell wall anchor domain-containing protein [Streptomyces sp. YS415]MCL7424373.1 LPXTG cell wall anchor domain-containing protein [Streptomyces sp. YS415]
MKLRRALAAAAATAAIAPIALMSAPAAFATDETSPAPSTSESTPAAGESTPAGDQTTTPAAEDSTPAGDDSTSPAPSASTPAGDDSTSPAPSGSTPPADQSTSPSPSQSTPSDEESEDDDEVVEECPVDENGDPVWDISEALHSSLTGLPETVVAGSGWTDFTFNVSNSSDETIEDIMPVVGVAAMDWELEDDYTDLVTVQVRSGGGWVDIATQFGEGGALNTFTLQGGQSISYDLRVSVAREVPSAVGIAIGLAEYSTEDGCWTSEDENYGIYFFEVLPAGSEPGKPDDSKPQTGGKDEITDVDEVDVDGELAETGSDSSLPALATIGGIAIVAGTGVMFAMKRRKAGAEA